MAWHHPPTAKCSHALQSDMTVYAEYGCVALARTLILPPPFKAPSISEWLCLLVRMRAPSAATQGSLFPADDSSICDALVTTSAFGEVKTCFGRVYVARCEEVEQVADAPGCDALCVVALVLSPR
ncbi:hypothetical protein Efla_007876 [Eimeria flavescens]